MKSNPELVIDMTSVKGAARVSLSTKIQLALFAIGYRWPDADGAPDMTQQVVEASAPKLHIVVRSAPALLCIQADTNEGPVVTDTPALVFDAETHLDDFLAAAKKALFTSGQELFGDSMGILALIAQIMAIVPPAQGDRKTSSDLNEILAGRKTNPARQ